MTAYWMRNSGLDHWGDGLFGMGDGDGFGGGMAYLGSPCPSPGGYPDADYREWPAGEENTSSTSYHTRCKGQYWPLDTGGR